MEQFDKILLGRAPADSGLPLVDFSPYDGFKLGISRQHATITRKEAAYYISDEGSSNGTWVNRVSLQPHTAHEIQSGDTIRMGQLSLSVYFHSYLTNNNTLHLKKLVPNKPFTPQDLATILSPYLLAIARVENVVNIFLKRQAPGVTVESIKIQAAIIHVQLAGAAEIIEFLNANITTLALDGEIRTPPGRIDPERAKSLASGLNNLSSRNKNRLTQLARNFLGTLPATPRDKAAYLESYVQDLLPDFYILMTSDVTITASDDTG